jgi:hypothetical protein
MSSYVPDKILSLQVFIPHYKQHKYGDTSLAFIDILWQIGEINPN